MEFFRVDIKTIIILLFVGNLTGVLVLLFYRNILEHRRPYWHFVGGKMLQGLGWLLLSLRSEITDIVSVNIGNTLLLSGFALEVFSLTTIGRSDRIWKGIYLSIAVIGITIFWIFATTPNLWVGFATAIAIILFLTASIALFLVKPTSLQRRWIGLCLGIVCIPLVFRAWNGFFALNEFTLMSRNMIQTLSFSALFLALIVGGSGFLVLFKEEADKQLYESEKKYRELAENANSIIYKRNLDGNITYFNEFAQTFFGYSENEILGKNVDDTIFRKTDQNGSSLSDENAGAYTKANEYGYREKECLRKNGGKVWVAWTNKVILKPDGTAREVLCVGTDITERRRVQEALRESENKFRDLSEKSVVGIYLIQDDLFKYVNAEFARIFEFAIDEMVDKLKPSDVVYSDDFPMVEENLRKRLSGEVKSLNFELRILTKNKHIKHLEIFSSRTFYKGKPAVIGSALDISVRRRLEGEREKLIDELTKALAQVKTLSGLLPICSSCKKIRDDRGYWNQIESYIVEHSEAEFSHGICPECLEKLYPNLYKKILDDNKS